jgi:hypothetical protein
MAIWKSLGETFAALSILFVFIGVAAMSAIAIYALDEDGKEVPKPMTRCIEVAEFEPKECNLLGLQAMEMHGCEYAGLIRLCGQFIPKDSLGN